MVAEYIAVRPVSVKGHPAEMEQARLFAALAAIAGSCSSATRVVGSCQLLGNVENLGRGHV